MELSKYHPSPDANASGAISLAASWLDDRIDAAINGACIVLNTTSTVSVLDEAKSTVHSRFSPYAVSMVSATMRDVFTRFILFAGCDFIFQFVGRPVSAVIPDKEAA